MKKTFTIIVVSLLIIQHAAAQNEALDEVNAQLRQLFSPLSRPSPSLSFLYEMSAHVTDSVFYQTHCPELGSTETWYKVYGEMYQSAYDTTALRYPGRVLNQGNSFSSDTIPIGIMNYAFYNLKPEALITNTYFNFDTVNTRLIDKTVRPGYPYNYNQIFIAAPLVPAARYTNPTFRVDPQLIFFDSNTAYNFGPNTELVIDFGDGQGWIVFDPATVTHRQVNYPGDSEVKITVAIRNKKEPEAFSGISTARLLIAGTTPLIPPDETIKFPGLTVGVYGSCNATVNTGKTVIYLAGIDLLDFIPSLNRTLGDIYTDMLADEKIIQLRNLGYTFWVVDWDHSTIDMRFNALYVVNLIEQLKASLDPHDQQQFVIMGESMGGVVGRYALTYMESERYASGDFSPFFADDNDINNILYLKTHREIYKIPGSWKPDQRRHNTRLLITVDSPHQGANVPLSVQLAYRHVMNIFGNYIGSAIKLAAQAFNILLDAQAAQQLLIYHVDTQSGLGQYKGYGRHSDNSDFYNQLAELGDYPRHAKVVLMSNGSLQGRNQRNPYTGTFRAPNDRLFAFKSELYARVLWIKVRIFGGNLRLLTNPNGQGQLLNAQLGFYRIRIKLKWFGIRISIGYNSLIDRQDYANVRPYCTGPGGYFGTPTGLLSTTPSQSGFNLSDNYWLLNLFHYNTQNDGNGCFIFDSHVGLNGFASVNADFDYCTDGTHFNFVPLQSALDYGHIDYDNINTDIENTNINANLALIPQQADVIIGMPGSGNWPHLFRREDEIQNLTGSSSTYFSCEPTDQKVIRGLLNLEIGDEELYLENNELIWHAAYTAEYDLHVNDRNPHYEYPSAPPAIWTGGGIYSKDNDFVIASTGFADFFFDAANTPTGIGFNFNNPSGNFVKYDQPLDHCCVDLTPNARTAAKPEKLAANKPVNIPELQVYPNPSNGSNIILQYSLTSRAPVYIELLNAAGIVIHTQKVDTPETSKNINSVINLQQKQLAPGMYIVKLHTAGKTLTSKVIVEK